MHVYKYDRFSSSLLNFKNKAGWWWHMPAISVLRRQGWRKGGQALRGAMGELSTHSHPSSRFFKTSKALYYTFL